MDIAKHTNCVRIVRYYARWITARCSWISREDVEQDLWEQALLAKSKFVGKDLDQFSRFLGQHLKFRSRNILDGHHKRKQRESEYAKLVDRAYWPGVESVHSLTRRIEKQLKKKKRRSFNDVIRVLHQLLNPDDELVQLGATQRFGRNGEPLQASPSRVFTDWQLGQYLNLSPMQVSRSLKAIQEAADQVINGK